MTPQKLNTTKEQAARMGVPFRTLENARSTGCLDIPYIRIGKTIRYDPAAVDVWLAKNTHNKLEA